MTFQEAWDQLTRKQSKLLDPDAVVTFKAGNLKTLLRQFYEQGGKSAPKAKLDPLAKYKDMLGI